MTSGKEMMKLLLDTHTFLWANSNPEKLSPKVAALLEDKENSLLLSIATVWEMQIKLGLGKLTVAAPLPVMIETNQEVNRLLLLSIELKHIFALESLPLHHKDPFDRLMIAQAKVENATLVTIDPLIHQYDVFVLW
jgi:PIN domain nuclease of toxin-antitoxin system